MEILIGNTDYNILIGLESVVSITGSYINADKLTIDTIENMLDKSYNTAISPNRYALDKSVLNSYTTTQNDSATLNVKVVNQTTVPASLTTTPVDLKSYEYIKNYFNTTKYIFVTGTTTSKFSNLYNSYSDIDLDVNNQPNTNLITNSSEPNFYNSANVVKSVDVNSPYKYNTNSVKGFSSISQLNNAVNSSKTQKNTNTTSNLKKIHVPIKISGTDQYGMILNIGDYLEYVLYINSNYPIKYIDFPDGTTTFMYRRADDTPQNNANVVLYPGLIEEPKIFNQVFIDRGVNNAFEPVIRLKNVTSVSELMKIGINYYKMNSQGFNFKNVK
jgi:hypothetical protein